MARPVVIQPVSFQFQNDWSVGLCSCCDDLATCCFAYWCCPCFMCQLAGDIDESCCGCFFVPNALAKYRMKIRSVLNIRGDACSDCLATTFCGFCAAIQMQNEIKRHQRR